MLFISNNWADAHQQTRLSALKKNGIDVTCLAVWREYYAFDPQIVPVWLGSMTHAAYSKRYKVYARLFYQMTKRVKSGTCIYVYGFDLMLVVMLFRIVSGRKMKILYELPDIRELFFLPGMSGKMIRFLEKFAIPKIDLLVVTSLEFVTEYLTLFRKIEPANYLVIENKVHLDQCFQPTLVSYLGIKNRKIVIGYFGVLRCPASLNCLIKMAGESHFEIVLRGIFMPSTRCFESVIKGMKNITYDGPYKVPEDLTAMYNDVDVVWAVYPFSNHPIGNHRWARTNRFYESLFFQKPLIVQRGTADAANAQRLGSIAIEIDLKHETRAIDQLTSKLDLAYLQSAKVQIEKIPESQYSITTEYQKLIQCLQQKIL